MVNLTYYLARSVEVVSWCVGAGAFEVNTHYLCHTCASSPQNSLCADCQDGYLDELSVLEYSDAFERRVNLAVGFASLVLGVTAAVVNVGEALWSEGGLVSFLTTPFARIMSPEAKFYPFILFPLAMASLLAFLCLVANTFVACFLLALNPLSRRHYRNMNLGVYVVFVVLGFAVGMIYVWGGMEGMEAVFVGAPVGLAGVCLGCAGCVGLGGEGEDGEGGCRLEEVEGKVGEGI